MFTVAATGRVMTLGKRHLLNFTAKFLALAG
jgi:hypothetical protein